MTERLAEIGARIEGVRQLGAVVNAMRGIAAARVQQARGQLIAVDHYTATIAAAIGRAVGVAPRSGPHARGRPAIVLFCAEQGFAGAFSEHVLDALAGVANAELFLIGTRGSATAVERGIVPDWTCAMPSHSAGVPKLADRVADALYGRIASGVIDRLDAIFTRDGHVKRSRLFPLDMTLFAASANLPLFNLPPDDLLGELTADYLHAQLCNAALHSFASESMARMVAMEAARHQIEEQLTSLQATQRHVRQDEITAEIIELAAGEIASQPAHS